jgi:hypothetical protein
LKVHSDILCSSKIKSYKGIFNSKFHLLIYGHFIPA